MLQGAMLQTAMVLRTIGLLIAMFGIISGILYIATPMGFLASVATVFLGMVLVGSVSVAGFVFRYPIREWFAGKRIDRALTRSRVDTLKARPGAESTLEKVDPKSLVWYEFINQGHKSESSKLSAENYSGAIHGLAKYHLAPPKDVGSVGRRPVASLVLRRDKKGQVRLFFGISKVGNTSSVSNLANQFGYTARIMDGPPPVGIKGGYVIAMRPGHGLDHNAVTEVPSESGAVLSALAGSSDTKFVGNIIVTMEAARPFEERRFAAQSNESAIQTGGEANKSAGGATAGGNVGAQTRTIQASMLRSTITVTADSASGESAESAFSSVIGAVASNPYKCQVEEPEDRHVRLSRWVIFSYFAPVSVLATLLGASGIMSPLLFVPVSIPALAGLLALFMRPSWLVREPVERSLRKGFMPVPAATWFSLRWLFWGKIRSNFRNAYGKERVGNEVAWPSCKEVVPLYSSPVAEMMIPDARSLHRAQRGEEIPRVELQPQFRNITGPDDIVFGCDPAGNICSIPLKNLYYGAVGFGDPFSGKTNLMHIIFTRVCALSYRNTQGYKISPILFENKGEGAYEAYEQVKRIPGTRLIEAHNPEAPVRICLEGPRLGDKLPNGDVVGPKEVREQIGRLVSDMQFAYGEAIKSRSRFVLMSSLTIAALLSPEEIMDMGDLYQFVDPVRPNLMKLANIIVKGDARIDITSKLQDLQEVEDDVIDLRRKLLGDSIAGVLGLLNKRETDALEPAQNKLMDLAKAEGMFSPYSREEVGVGEIVNSFAPTILNLGPFRKSDEEYSNPIDTQLQNVCLKMVEHAMWTYINTHCNGWQKRKRMIPMFSDEASLFAVESSGDGADKPVNVVAAIRDQGRSKGACLIAFTQYRHHLPDQARESFGTYRTRFQLVMEGKEDLDDAIDGLGGEEEVPYTRRNISLMPKGVSIVNLMLPNAYAGPATMHTPPISEIGPTLLRKRDARAVGREMVKCYRRKIDREDSQMREVADDLPAPTGRKAIR